MDGSFGSLVVRRMTGLVIVVAGLCLGVVGWLLLRRQGSGWRIGRLLAAAPQRSLAEAIELARAEAPAYVRVHGRVDSSEEFPDDAGRPIVFRRRQLQRRSGRSGWETLDDERLAVPFGLSQRADRIAIDVDALGAGLVVVPRVADGVASELPDGALERPLPELPPDTPVRLRIDQVSTIDHATAAGVPGLGPDGVVQLSAGLGRPLVLTNLEVDEAMRVLASEQRTSLLAATALLVAAPIVTVLGLVVLALGW